MMNSITSITIASLALANAASLPTSNGTEPRSDWVDVCAYRDSSGETCCAPGMEGHKYLVVPQDFPWQNNAVECQLYGGWLTVLETQQEWACIENWVLDSQQTMPMYQRFALSLREYITHPGKYLWQNEDGTESLPEWDLPWATSHPQGESCVSMVIGTEVETEGEFVDGDCFTDVMWAICEQQ